MIQMVFIVCNKLRVIEPSINLDVVELNVDFAPSINLDVVELNADFDDLVRMI